MAAKGSAPVAAVSATGEVIVAFNERTGGNGLAAAMRRRGHAFGRPGHLLAGAVGPAQLAMADDGEAVLATWTRGGAAHFLARRPGAAFPADSALESPFPSPIDDLALMTAPDGTGMVTALGEIAPKVMGSWRVPGGRWGATLGAWAYYGSSLPTAAVGEDNIFRLVRPERSSSGSSTSIVSTQAGLGGWALGLWQVAATADETPAPRVTGTAVAAGAASDSVITWTVEPEQEPGVRRLWAVVAPSHRPYGVQRALPVPWGQTTHADAPSAAVNAQGTVAVGWATAGPGSPADITVQVSRRDAQPELPAVLDRGGVLAPPALAFDPKGALLAVWRAAPGTGTLRASTRFRGQWCAPRDVGRASGAWSLAADPRGGAVLTWSDRRTGKVLAATWAPGAGCAMPRSHGS